MSREQVWRERTKERTSGLRGEVSAEGDVGSEEGSFDDGGGVGRREKGKRAYHDLPLRDQLLEYRELLMRKKLAEPEPDKEVMASGKDGGKLEESDSSDDDEDVETEVMEEEEEREEEKEEEKEEGKVQRF